MPAGGQFFGICCKRAPLICPQGPQFSNILEIIENANGLVVIDEAYADYSKKSFIQSLKKYKNLAILKTMSKVGFASLRVGFLIASKETIEIINKVRLPYNLSTLSNIIAQDFFDNDKKYSKNIQKIVKERDRINIALKSYDKFKVYPSDSNFIFISCSVLCFLILL